jgi:predicted DNA-binding transcriptional regulator
VPTGARKAWAVQLQENHSVTIAMSCAIGGLNRCVYYYQPKLPDDSVIMLVLSAITDKHLRWGFPKCFNHIRKLGYKWNHKRVYRIYCQLKLNLRVKRKQRNGYIERFNRTYHTEVLDLYLFNNLEQTRKVTEEWLTIYNTERPHETLKNMTPSEYKTLKQAA